MYPILFSLGSYPITTFGVFLILAFFISAFTIWKLCRVYDVNEEKTTNLIILTFFGGLIGARLYAVLTHWQIFGSLSKILLITKYPGLSFWGGFLGGALIFWLFTKRTKFNIWQMADFASIGFLAGLIVGDIGCFLGGCGYGIVSSSVVATPVVGLVGNRLPISLIESFVLLLIFLRIWKTVMRFHFAGKITAALLFLLGIVKFTTEFFRGDSTNIAISVSKYSFAIPGVSYGHLFSGLLLILGVVVFYTQSDRSPLGDIKDAVALITTAKGRRSLHLQLRKSWYNSWVGFRILIKQLGSNIKNSPKSLKRRFRVKATPTDFK